MSDIKVLVKDATGYEYDIAVLPAANAPLIKSASSEILQEMQVNSIIQNLENVSKLMFIAYNALSGTAVQSKMTGLQARYLTLMDESAQTITTFKSRSIEICKNVSKAYEWLIKGNEAMAVVVFEKCARSAEEMSSSAEKLADGFQSLSDDAVKVLQSTQDESALQYKKMDEVQKELGQYNANLAKCSQLRDSINEDIVEINNAYKRAVKAEDSARSMKKGLMITQIVTSCIGAIIPSVSSLAGSQGGGSTAGQERLEKDIKMKQDEQGTLKKQQESEEAEKTALEEKLRMEEEAIAKLSQSIEVLKAKTAMEEDEREAEIAKAEAELKPHTDKRAQLEKDIAEKDKAVTTAKDAVDSAQKSIDNLNSQLQKLIASTEDELQRAEEATERALNAKLEMEKERRNTLASIQEFTALISAGIKQKNVAETAVQTLHVAIKCIKQVVVALKTASKFWKSMEVYCKTLSANGLGAEIKDLSQGLTLEEREEYYKDDDFKMVFLTYICRWAALYYVCDDYKKRSEKVRGMVADNIIASSTREEEWQQADRLAGEMKESIALQLADSREISSRLTA